MEVITFRFSRCRFRLSVVIHVTKLASKISYAENGEMRERNFFRKEIDKAEAITSRLLENK